MMYRLTLAAVATFGLAGATLAHPGGHGEEDVPVYTGHDCSGLAGEFDISGKRTAQVTVYNGKVIVAPRDGMAAVGDCLAPVVDGTKQYPRAKIRFDASFGKDLSAGDCCTIQLKNDALTFDKAPTIVWKRRKH